MSELLSGTVAQVVLGTVILCVLVAAAVYLVASFRDYGDEGTLDPHQTLANVDEMRARGDISEEEYRTIKASTRRQFGVGNDFVQNKQSTQNGL